MDVKDLVLAIIPAGLAITIEALNPFNSEFFERQARTIVMDEIGDSNDPKLSIDARQAIEAARRILAGSAQGAASLVGVTPTFVSFLATSVTLFMLLNAPAWWLVGLMILVMVALLIIWRILSNRDILGVATRPIELPFGIEKSASEICSFCIYITNVIIIMVALAVFVARHAE